MGNKSSTQQDSQKPPVMNKSQGISNNGSDKVAAKVAEANLANRVKQLEADLADARRALQRANGDDSTTTTTTTTRDSLSASILHAPTSKRGYLFKWQDRTIGWGGTKWALRFVSLEKGRLLYYGSHHDAEPRYELALRGCAVRDEGYKRNRKHVTMMAHSGSSSSTGSNDPPISESGAYFHVFSIYQRMDKDDETDEYDVYSDIAKSNNGVSEIIPLLRFSTPSMAEKMQWMSLLSETCAYCETDEFAEHEQQLMEERRRRRDEHQAMALAMPQAERGTLPALYFAPAQMNASTQAKRKLKRTASGTKLPQFQTKSTSRDAEKAETPRSTRGYPASKPMHRVAAPSYLSEEAPVQNYRGLLNLAVILLVVSNARLLIESYRNYGDGLVWASLQHVSSFAASGDKWGEFPFLTGVAVLGMACLQCFVIEYLLSRRRLWNSVGMTLHQFNAHAALGVTTYIVWQHIDLPFIGAALLFHGVIVWMKLLSYALANEDYRITSTSDGDDKAALMLTLVKDLDPGAGDIVYPKNITLGNMVYFLMAPTLTYQIVFPRTPRVRFYKVVSFVLRLFVVACLMFFLTAQVITPNLQNLAQDLETTGGRFTVGILSEYALKLSIANMYCWLLVFYGFFHLYLNLTGELLRFGDRVFYRDWWNSSEMSAYWRLWNTPVHYWLVRHVYFPCVRWGMSKTAATFSVFFLSAVVHELLISTPFHMVRPWIYLAMMGQIPLVWMTKLLNKRLPGSSVSNIVFWLAFFVGQPMCVLLYTIDYQAMKLGSSWVIENKHYCWASLLGNACETAVAGVTTAVAGSGGADEL